jgi:hypothetical protein
MAMDIEFIEKTGAGADIDLNLGYVPDKVIVTNVTDNTVVDTWYRQTSANGTSIRTDAAVGLRASPGGMTPLDRVSTANGFVTGIRIGAAIAANGKRLMIETYRNEYSARTTA